MYSADLLLPTVFRVLCVVICKYKYSKIFNLIEIICFCYLCGHICPSYCFSLCLFYVAISSVKISFLTLFIVFCHKNHFPLKKKGYCHLKVCHCTCTCSYESLILVNSFSSLCHRITISISNDRFPWTVQLLGSHVNQVFFTILYFIFSNLFC